MTFRAVLNGCVCVFVHFSACELLGNVSIHHAIDRGLANVGVILEPWRSPRCPSLPVPSPKPTPSPQKCCPCTASPPDWLGGREGGGGGCYHVPLLGWQHLQAQSECWARPQIQGQELPAPSFPLLHCLSQISILTPPAGACESATGFCWCVLLSAGSRVQWSPGEHTATGRKYLTAGAGRTPSRLGRKPSLVGSDERIQLSDCTPAPLQPRSYWVLGLIPLLPLLSSIR